jgi:hypothetical protein
MTEPSLAPGTDETDAIPGRRATSGTSRWLKVVGILGLVALLWVGSEMYEVLYGDIGGGGHEPGQDAPVENQDQDIDTDDQDDHDPSQGGH